MNRKTIAVIGYIILALSGAVMMVLGALTFKEQAGASLFMILTGIIFLLIGFRGPKQFLQREKQSEQDKDA